MYVEVDHERAPQPPRPLERAERDGHVVEDAEPLGPVGHRVVRAAGEVAGDPVVERHPAGVERPLHRQPAPADEGWLQGSPIRRSSAAVSAPPASASR